MVSDIRTRVDHKQRLQLAPQYRPSHKATNFNINIHSKFVIYIHSINSPHKYASDSLSPTCVTLPPSHAHHTHTKAAEETIAIYIYCRHIVCLCQTFLFFASPNIFSPKRFSCIFFFFGIEIAGGFSCYSFRHNIRLHAWEWQAEARSRGLPMWMVWTMNE